MDESRFAPLARAVAPAGTRRRLVTPLAALPLGGLLAVADEAGEVVAERVLARVQRHTTQHNRQQHNHTRHPHEHTKKPNAWN